MIEKKPEGLYTQLIEWGNKERMAWFMKKDVKVLLIMLAVSIVMFFALPLVINLQPNEQVSIYGTQVIYLVLNVIFMGVIGWYSLDFEKFGYLVPIPITLVFVVSQIVVMGTILPELILNYIEAAYMIYILRKLMTRVRKKQEAKNQPKPFPKSVKKR